MPRVGSTGFPLEKRRWWSKRLNGPANRKATAVAPKSVGSNNRTSRLPAGIMWKSGSGTRVGGGRTATTRGALSRPLYAHRQLDDSFHLTGFDGREWSLTFEKWVWLAQPADLGQRRNPERLHH